MTGIKIVMVGDSLRQNGGIATVERLILRYQLPTLDIHLIGTHESGTMAHRIAIFAQGLVQLIRRLLTRQVDLVHVHIADWGSVPRKVIVVLIALLFRQPVVMHAHGPEFHLTYRALPIWTRRFLQWVFRQCAQFIVLSQSWQDFYVNSLNLDRSRVVVLSNPIELPDTIPDRLSDRSTQNIIILFLGRIGCRKGTFDLIQAFSQVAVHQPSLRLLLAGDGDLEQGIALVDQLQLGDQVRFLGWIDDRQRNTLLAQADLFVLPSYNEALPMALLEAMAWGLPVITCPVGGIPDVVVGNENGLLVTPGDVGQLAVAMQTLVDDPLLRQSLGLAARRRVSEFDVRQYMVKLEKIYGDCVPLPRRGAGLTLRV